MAQFRSRYYAITAKHCLRDRTYDSVRIRLIPCELNFLTVKQLVVTESEGEDFLDLALFEIESDSLPDEALREKHFLDLNHHSGHSLDKSILAVIGYPTELNTIEDYASRTINTGGFSADGRYSGPAEDKHCSKMRFNDLAQIKDLNGLSGSPVLAFDEIRENAYRHYFAGVLIRATRESGTGRFINAAVVIALLNRLSVTTK